MYVDDNLVDVPLYEDMDPLFSVRNVEEYRIKLILIGDSGVGKSCLLMRYTDDKFTNRFISTIGIDFKVKTIYIDNIKVRLQIWDTAGQERFQTVTNAYYRGVDGAMLVYDVTDGVTLDNVRKWIRDANTYCPRDCEKLLIGNKCDDVEGRQLTYENGQAFSKTEKIQFMEASAKTGENVSLAFETLTRKVLKAKIESTPERTVPRYILSTKPQSDDNGGSYRCC